MQKVMPFRVWYSFWTLLRKEVWRFMKVPVQTLLAPIVTVLLYLLVFSQIWPPVERTQALLFIIPGLMLLASMQNAFANTSSSYVQAKIIGHIIFLWLSPLSAFWVYWAFVLAAMLRGLLIILGFALCVVPFVHLPIFNVFWILLFGILSGLLLGAAGLWVGVVSYKFDEMAMYQNFVILPLTFLSGVFYPLNDLPPLWYALSLLNPLVYLIDGFRYGFLGESDLPILWSFGLSLAFFVLLTGLVVHSLSKSSYLRH
jgi:ABC-2 type transport system permease protein